MEIAAPHSCVCVRPSLWSYLESDVLDSSVSIPGGLAHPRLVLGSQRSGSTKPGSHFWNYGGDLVRPLRAGLRNSCRHDLASPVLKIETRGHHLCCGSPCPAAQL